jgi:hypothetical protein
MTPVNHVFTGPRWIELDRRLAFWRFWKRVAYALAIALALMAVLIVFDAGASP